MKKVVLIILLLPIFASAQLDFEIGQNKSPQVYFPGIESLETVPQIKRSRFERKYSSSSFSKTLTRENFRQPVSMAEVMASVQVYAGSDIKINIDPQSLGIMGGNSSYSADGSTKVKNIAYKESGFFFADSCPPTGVCPRCAPYRMGRSFY